ncbi:MAG: hypothetical protein Q9191_005251 [Dirinaria sp. TL-2023a]
MPVQEFVVDGLTGDDKTKPRPEDIYERLRRERVICGPFEQSIGPTAITGPSYVTAQVVVQQVAYALSSWIWTFSSESFDLDQMVKSWKGEMINNAYGYQPRVEPMQIRHGAGSATLGCIFSPDFDFRKRHVPQSILASASALTFLRPSLEQLSLLNRVASPCVLHIAAVDYAPVSSKLVADYITATTVADELGFGMVATFSGHESQHMALFATLLASLVPTVHIYDGIHVARETMRLVDSWDFNGLHNAYTAILPAMSDPDLKKATLDSKVVRALDALNEELGTVYKPFEYFGHQEPDLVLVVFGSVEATLGSEVASALSTRGAKVGLIAVRVYRPFIESEFLATIPKSVKAFGVLGQVHDSNSASDPNVRSNLYNDVAATLLMSDHVVPVPEVIDIKYPREEVWTPVSIAAAFQLLSPNPILHLPRDSSTSQENHLQLFQQSIDISHIQHFIFWELDDSPAADASTILGQALAKDSSHHIALNKKYDNLTEGGVSRTDIRRSKKTIKGNHSIDTADLIVVSDQSLLKHYDVLNSLKSGGRILLKYPGVKDDELEGKLPVNFRRAVAAKGAELFILDTAAVEEIITEPASEIYLLQVAFLRVGLSTLEKIALEKLANIGASTVSLEKAAKSLDHTLREIEIPKEWTSLETDADPLRLATDISINSYIAYDKSEHEPPTYLRDWRTAAKGLAFKEAYGTKPLVRPDIAVKTYRVRVKENRRLTPMTYERNIFHIEFDLGDSGLTYDIGEALGVHAQNDKTEVMEFMKFYKLDPEEVVEVPSREDANVLENRTVFQSLMQNIDIFGRPPKRFYEALAEFADNPKEEKELRALGGSEGAVEFKRRAEVDTVTYADILLEFPSAHPSFHDIVRIVAPMKRREYSIASCQKVTPTSVALMIVVVGWVDPRKRDRWGQATRYLNSLRIGDEVVVSVKPSVMKLPPQSTQPLIMAGLGTGLAPFRAFVQHRAWERQQGKEIGSVLLYMGSRHQREEYCYGEEWEAYQDAGIITLLGRAFSRDQPQKIYIQDRMRETMNDIIRAYIKEDGAFYLCGPTWPVPDVTNVLEEAIGRDARSVGKKVDPRKEIDKLKDLSRYVLEVY